MAEAEVNYASVMFKSNKQRPEAKKEEETVYDEVKKKSESTEQTADTNGVLPGKKANSRRRQYQLLACCLGILCVILLLGLIVVCYFLATLSDITELNQLNKNNKTLMAANRNLTNLNDKLSLDNDNLRRERNNLTVQLGNLTQNYTVLESKITNLKTENQQLGEQNENLTTQKQQLKNSLTEQIQTCIELNISRAQWSIDAYCPKEADEKQCNACQEGWNLSPPSCYVIHNDPAPSGQITWEQARANCTGKNADLVVVQNQQEKTVVDGYSYGSFAYWIGLRVEEGRWKWINGSDLNETSWIRDPTEGHCAVSIQGQEWTSVMCEDKKRWICKQKALTV